MPLQLNDLGTMYMHTIGRVRKFILLFFLSIKGIPKGYLFVKKGIQKGKGLNLPCIRQLSPQYDRQSKFWCPNETIR